MNCIGVITNCHRCTHYYVTWDPNFPHGCRAMEFKSRRYPIDDVRREIQGKDCLAFARKKTVSRNSIQSHHTTSK